MRGIRSLIKRRACKKLIEAAQVWAAKVLDNCKSSGKGKNNLFEALEAFGIEDYQEEAPEELLDIIPENHETVHWFLMLQRRWVYGAMGGIISFDDAAIQAQMNIRGIKKNKRIEILNGLMTMENAALEILNGNNDG